MKSRLLIANRGEIAVRIAKTARKKGFHVIGICREVDKGSSYLSSMDEIACFESNIVNETFLSPKTIVEIAKKHKADFLHPGYGFLSESSEFASLVESSGIQFVGPNSKTISLLGDKISAKKLARKLEIPTVPAVEGIKSVKIGKSIQEKISKEVSFPVLVKAGAGGGGRGMRIVKSADELSSAIKSSREEALRAFGDGTLFIERFIERARHIEVQVIGDFSGNVIHLYERDCSLQRKFQKIIEIAPPEGLPLKISEQIRDCSIRLAKSAGLTNAATMEFLYDTKRKEVYFIECNPRLQVEHTITEEICSVDLVFLQLDVASGKTLPDQNDIKRSGVSIQARVCAEVMEDNSRPSVGYIKRYNEPENSRIDSGIQEGDYVSNDFDSLLVKVIQKGKTHLEARQNLINSLNNLVITGVENSTGVLLSILKSIPGFDKVHTTFIEKNLKKISSLDLNNLSLSLQGLYESLVDKSSLNKSPFESRIREAEFDLLPGLKLQISNFDYEEITKATEAIIKSGLIIKENSFDTYDLKLGNNTFNCKALLKPQAPEFKLEGIVNGYQFSLSPLTLENQSDYNEEVSDGEIISELPGTILTLSVKKGQFIQKGAAILTFDSMKTEHLVCAPISGKVKEVYVKINENFERGKLLLQIEESKK